MYGDDEFEARENGAGGMILALGLLTIIGGGLAYYFYSGSSSTPAIGAGSLTSAQASELALKRAKSIFPWMDTFQVVRVSKDESSGSYIVRVSCDGDEYDFVVTAAGQVTMESKAKTNPLTFSQTGRFAPRGRF